MNSGHTGTANTSSIKPQVINLKAVQDTVVSDVLVSCIKTAMSLHTVSPCHRYLSRYDGRQIHL